MLRRAKIVTENEYSEIFPEDDDPLIPRKLAAKRLGQKPNTLAVWDCKKKYNWRKVLNGRNVFYYKSDVERVRLERQRPA